MIQNEAINHRHTYWAGPANGLQINKQGKCSNHRQSHDDQLVIWCSQQSPVASLHRTTLASLIWWSSDAFWWIPLGIINSLSSSPSCHQHQFQTNSKVWVDLGHCPVAGIWWGAPIQMGLPCHRHHSQWNFPCHRHQNFPEYCHDDDDDDERVGPAWGSGAFPPTAISGLLLLPSPFATFSLLESSLSSPTPPKSSFPLCNSISRSSSSWNLWSEQLLSTAWSAEPASCSTTISSTSTSTFSLFSALSLISSWSTLLLLKLLPASTC